MNPSDLEAIRMKYRDDPDECFRELLSKWLKQGDPKPTWASLAIALKSQTVKFEQLSKDVQKNHLSCDGETLECTDSHRPKPKQMKENADDKHIIEHPERTSYEFSNIDFKAECHTSPEAEGSKQKINQNSEKGMSF